MPMRKVKVDGWSKIGLWGSPISRYIISWQVRNLIKIPVKDKMWELKKGITLRVINNLCREIYGNA